MSLGLNDLKKKSVKASTTSNKSEDWARSSRTARPWTSAELTKGPKARKPVDTDAAMSLEWANDHTASLNVFDMEVQSALVQLRDAQMLMKERAIELERKIKRAAMGPLNLLLNFVEKQIQK